MELPAGFRQRIRDVFGPEGDAWLAALPSLIAEYERRWRLDVAEPFPLTYNFAAPARGDGGRDVVLKLGVPSRELRTEIAALRHYDGHGAARLLAADAERGSMLLERLLPGTPLSEVVDDAEATLAAADVMRQWRRPPPAEHDFPTVGDWARGFERVRARFDGGTGPLPARLVTMAESRYAELLASSEPPVLLHGDLHHDNILRAERQRWLAIDPKGVIGEPAYETGALLRNPMPQLLQSSDPKRVLARRVDLLAERLGFDRQRIVEWGAAQAVLSAWWSVDDHERGGEPAIAVAELLLSL